MASPESPTAVVVFGATGTQGGGAVKALLQTGRYTVKAVTRDVHQAAAQRLREAGAEPVEADLNDVASLEQAFQGVHAVFLATAASLIDAEEEYQQGRNAIAAAQRAGVQHLIFSALEDTRPYIQHDDSYPTVCQFQGGPSKNPFHDAKGAIKVELQQSGLPYTCLYTWSFFENFHKRLSYSRQPDGTAALKLPIPPDQTRQWHSSDAIGSAVAEILQGGHQYQGADVQVSTHAFSFADAVRIVSEATGRQVSYQQQKPGQQSQQPLLLAPGAAGMANMFRLGGNAQWMARRDHVKVIGRGPGLKEWAEQHRQEIIERIKAGLAT